MRTKWAAVAAACIALGFAVVAYAAGQDLPSAVQEVADTLPMATLTKWALAGLSTITGSLAAWTYAQERKVATLQAEIRDVQAYSNSIREDIRDIRSDIRSIRDTLARNK